MKEITRRGFLKGLLAVPITISFGSFITDRSMAAADVYFNKLKFNPNEMFRHAVSISMWNVRPLEGTGISGSNRLVGNEESLAISAQRLTEAEAFEEGKRILWDYINLKIPKRYHKRISFGASWDDIHNEFGVAFCYHPKGCPCQMKNCLA